MKTKFQILIVLISVCITGIAFSQVTLQGNVRPNPAVTPDAFLGWDGTGSYSGPLEIRNDFTAPIILSTIDTERMRIDTFGFVGIGTIIPKYKLDVTDSTNSIDTAGAQLTITANFLSSNPNANISVGVVATAVKADVKNIGMAGYAPTIADSGDITMTNTGMRGEASGSNVMNVGVSGKAGTDTPLPNQDSLQNVGVEGVSTGSVFQNIGLWGKASKGAHDNIAVLGDASEPSNYLANCFGVNGRASGSKFSNFGLFGSANYYPMDDTCRLINVGVQANASGSPYENRSGSFPAAGTRGFNYSVWARSTAGEPPAPWGTAPYYSAGHFLGDVFVLGSIINHPTDFMEVDTSKTKDLPADSALIWLSKLHPKSLFVDAGLDSFPLGWHYGFDTDSVRHNLRAATRDIFRPEKYTSICDTTIPFVHDVSVVHNELIPVIVAGVNQLHYRLDTSGLGLWREYTPGNVILRDLSSNAGIGTTAPTSKLNVVNAQSSSVGKSGDSRRSKRLDLCKHRWSIYSSVYNYSS